MNMPAFTLSILRTRKQKSRAALVCFLFLSTVADSATKCDTCPRDKRGHIERSTSAKTEFRLTNPCPITGSSKGACSGYVIDHVIALKRNGTDTPDNMQWQTFEEAKEKDKWE